MNDTLGERSLCTEGQVERVERNMKRQEGGCEWQPKKRRNQERINGGKSIAKASSVVIGMPNQSTGQMMRARNIEKDLWAIREVGVSGNEGRRGGTRV
jgi:hypothetical protein